MGERGKPMENKEKVRNMKENRCVLGRAAQNTFFLGAKEPSRSSSYMAMVHAKVFQMPLTLPF